MTSKRIMVFGTFDGLHAGHRDFLRQAKTYGEHLIIVVSRDTVIEKVCGARPETDEIDRLSALLSDGIAEDIVMGHESNKLRVLVEHKPDIIVLGFTQKYLVDSIQEKTQELGMSSLKIVYADSFEEERYKPSNFNNKNVHL